MKKYKLGILLLEDLIVLIISGILSYKYFMGTINGNSTVMGISFAVTCVLSFISISNIIEAKDLMNKDFEKDGIESYKAAKGFFLIAIAIPIIVVIISMFST